MYKFWIIWGCFSIELEVFRGSTMVELVFFLLLTGWASGVTGMTIWLSYALRHWRASVVWQGDRHSLQASVWPCRSSSVWWLRERGDNGRHELPVIVSVGEFWLVELDFWCGFVARSMFDYCLVCFDEY